MKFQKGKKLCAGIFVAALVFINFSCQSQQPGNQTATGKEIIKTQSPTEAYKMLYAACKAKDAATIKQLMSKSSLGLAEFSASQQKKSADQILENGLVAPTLADSLTEMRDERMKDNFGAVEVFNPKDNRWEDLPFVLEDGSWKLAVGDVFQNTYKSPGKGQAQIENEASNTMMPMSSNSVTDFPPIPDGNKSVEVPKEKKPKK